MNKLLSATALACVLILPALAVKAGEAGGERPSDADIRAFTECQRGKATEPCIFPQRRPPVAADDLAGQAGDDFADAPFYQAPASELVRGSANAELRATIHRAHGYRTYSWGLLRTQDGPAEPFGSYSRRDGQDGGGANGANASTAGGNTTGNTASASASGNTGNTSSNTGGGQSAGQGRGENCKGDRGRRGR